MILSLRENILLDKLKADLEIEKVRLESLRNDLVHYHNDNDKITVLSITPIYNQSFNVVKRLELMIQDIECPTENAK